MRVDLWTDSNAALFLQSGVIGILGQRGLFLIIFFFERRKEIKFVEKSTIKRNLVYPCS